MKRQIWLGVIAVVVVILAVIIFGNVQKKADVGTEADVKKILVVINGGPQETDKVAVKRMKESIARFNKLYPNITTT